MNYNCKSVDQLFKTILNLETIDECYAFFDDLCTIKEVLDMAKRLNAAVLLSEGRNYQEINEKIGISTATIGRVSKCLRYGAGGYTWAILKLGKKEE